ncbi:MAG: hypothetical protein ACOH10_13780 [Rhodoglobus sp.]
MIDAALDAPAYFVDDVPVAPLVIELDTDLDLTEFVDVEARLIAPDFTTSTTLVAVRTGAEVSVEFPETTVFTERGVYTLTLALVGLDARTSLPPFNLVAEETDGWHTLTSARDEWADADQSDVVLFTLLEAARDAVTTYAPALDDGERMPLSWRQAQLMQARAVWNATKSGGANEIGADGFATTFRVYPLDKNIRQLLRPNSGVPSLW